MTLVIGGGSGHYPAFCGYVGPGLAQAAVMGNIFASPSGEQIYWVTKAAAGERGVLYCYGNYSGDVLNFDMAAARCSVMGWTCAPCASTTMWPRRPRNRPKTGAGSRATFLCSRSPGPAWHAETLLDEVERLTQKANHCTRSFGVAFGGCTLPGKSEPLFTVEPGHMELGLGVHGEPGVSSSHMRPASEVANLLLDTLLADKPAGGGEQVAVLLNGLGSTKYEELFVLYKDVHRRLTQEGLQVQRPVVGELVTSLDMAGCSLSLLWLDEELMGLLAAPCESAAYTQR